MRNKIPLLMFVVVLALIIQVERLTRERDRTLTAAADSQTLAAMAKAERDAAMALCAAQDAKIKEATATLQKQKELMGYAVAPAGVLRAMHDEGCSNMVCTIRGDRGDRVYLAVIRFGGTNRLEVFSGPASEVFPESAPPPGPGRRPARL